jgi:hypothetical protein
VAASKNIVNVQAVQGENGDRATEEAAEKLENLSLSCDPAADSQVYSFTWYPLDGVQSIRYFLSS